MPFYKQNETIFKIEPFVSVLNLDVKRKFCDFCFKKRERLIECADCHLNFYCNIQCEKSDQIHKIECGFLAQIENNQKLLKAYNDDLFRLYVRILLKIANQDKYLTEIDNFNNLNDEYANLLKDEFKMRVSKTFISSFQELTNDFFNQQFTDKKLISVFGKMIINNFEIRNQEKVIGLALYLCTEKIRHSCDPNAIIRFDGSTLLVTAKCDISPTEKVQISYCDENLSEKERRAFLLKKFYFECSCSKCTGIKIEQQFSTLKFKEEAIKDTNLRLSARIANKFLEHNYARFVLYDFSIDFDSFQEKLNRTAIVYSIQPDYYKKTILSWTEKKIDSRVIFINNTFNQRLNLLQTQDPKPIEEIENITFFISVLLIHELAHLLFRWKGLKSSPRKYREAGNYFERKLFDGTMHILTHPKSCWDVNSEHYGIRLVNDSLKRKYENRVCYKYYITKCCNFQFGNDPQHYIPPLIEVKEILENTLSLKQCEEADETCDDKLESDPDEISEDFVYKCPLMSNLF